MKAGRLGAGYTVDEPRLRKDVLNKRSVVLLRDGTNKECDTRSFGLHATKKNNSFVLSFRYERKLKLYPEASDAANRRID